MSNWETIAVRLINVVCAESANLRTAAEVTVGILILLSLYGWVGYRDATDALEDEKRQSRILAANLASCMNGGAVYDKATDTAHFCGKVTSVKLGVKNLPFAP